MINNDKFDINNISKSDLNKLANLFEEYLFLLEECMIIPEEISIEKTMQVYEGIKTTKKLIKKLRKGKNVFKKKSKWDYYDN